MSNFLYFPECTPHGKGGHFYDRPADTVFPGGGAHREHLRRGPGPLCHPARRQPVRADPGGGIGLPSLSPGQGPAAGGADRPWPGLYRRGGKVAHPVERNAGAGPPGREQPSGLFLGGQRQFLSASASTAAVFGGLAPMLPDLPPLQLFSLLRLCGRRIGGPGPDFRRPLRPRCGDGPRLPGTHDPGGGQRSGPAGAGASRPAGPPAGAAPALEPGV